jgi:hypothetical protein
MGEFLDSQYLLTAFRDKPKGVKSGGSGKSKTQV